MTSQSNFSSFLSLSEVMLERFVSCQALVVFFQLHKIPRFPLHNVQCLSKLGSFFEINSFEDIFQCEHIIELLYNIELELCWFRKTLLSITKRCKQFEPRWSCKQLEPALLLTWKRSLTGNIWFCVFKCDSSFLEEERGQKRKRELDEEGEDDEDDWESSWV